MPFKLKCPACGHSLKVPESALGKKGKCPSCQTSIRIPEAPGGSSPAPAPRPAPAPVAAASSGLDQYADDADGFGDGLDDGLDGDADTGAYELNDLADDAPPTFNQLPAMPAMAAQGGAHAMPAMPAAAAPAAPMPTQMNHGGMYADYEAGGGAGEAGTSVVRVILGIFLGGIASVVCAAIWFAVLYFTGYEIGFVAIGVGFLCGLAVVVGAGEQNAVIGVFSAMCAGGSILIVRAFEILVGVPVGDAFTPYDILWFFLALGTAFRVGAVEGDDSE